MDNFSDEYFFILEMHVSEKAKTNKEDWYHGTLERRQAVQVLKSAESGDGTFLVRLSTKGSADLVLTLLCDQHDYHYIIHKQVILCQLNHCIN